MSILRRNKVRAAIQGIRRLYALGRKIPCKKPHGEVFGLGIIRVEAERRHVNEDTIRKARQFASPEDGYTKKEVRALCAQIAAIQPEQEDGMAVIGQTHVIRLLTVKPKKRRAALQSKAIKEGWSVGRLEEELTRRYGTRREGGRRRRMPNDLLGLLTQVEVMCESWRRWRVELSDPAKQQTANGVRLNDLTKSLQNQIVEATQCLLRLQSLVVRELNRLQPDRLVRQVFVETNGDAKKRSRAK